jgi:4-hydroxybenzoate polyprenyltransferase
MKKLLYFIFTWRPFKWRTIMFYELLSYPFMYTSVVMLAYGIKDYNWEILKILILTVLSLFSGYFAALMWNDITDKEIDKIAHPDRSIPSGRISSKNLFLIALFFSTTTFICAYLISIWCLLVVGVNALFVTFHNKYLKKIIKIPAYSEIFTPVQWLTVAIFGFVAIWTAIPQSTDIILDLPVLGYIAFDQSSFLNLIILVLFTYFADDAHDIPEGIHDCEGDKKLGVRTYATSFGPKVAAKISFSMIFLSGALAIILFFRTILSPIFLIPFLVVWIYTLSWSYKLIKTEEKDMGKIGLIVGQKGFDYFIISYNLIFLDIFVQLLIYHFS